MKKTLVRIILLSSILALSACGNKSNDTQPAGAETNADLGKESDTEAGKPESDISFDSTQEGSKEDINQDGQDKEEGYMQIQIGDKKYNIVLEENETADAFREMLPLTLDMQELNKNEKYFYLEQSLPSAAESVGKIEAGDIMLYGDNCIVLFYKSFSTSYTYTRIGHVVDPSGIEKAVGKGDVSVLFRIAE